MEAYRHRVEDAAIARLGEPIFNGSLEHAAVIVEVMFAHAKEQVSILTGSLNPRVYGRDEIREQARIFVADPSHKLRILAEENIVCSTHPLLQDIGKGSVEVRILPEEYKASYSFHFLVLDHDSYRFESDKNSPTAVAAFGDASGAADMLSIFEDLWRFAKPMAN